MEDIGLNIKTFRLREDMTQAELAKKIGVSRTAISSWEVGRTEPSIGDIEALANVFGCLKTDLIGPSGIEYYFIASQEEKTLIDGYRNADQETRNLVARILKYAEAMRGQNDDRTEKP